MKRSRKKIKKKDETPILIEKVEILSDDKSRGWFRFWTLESDEKWYGSWYSTYESIFDKKRVLELVFQDYVKDNFSGGGVLAMRLYIEDGTICEYQYVSSI